MKKRTIMNALLMHPSYENTRLRSAIMTITPCLLLVAPTSGETIDNRLGKFEAGYPTADTVEKLYDELGFQRAVQAYLWALPMASYGAMADAHRGLGADSHTVVIVDKLAQPRHLALTSNQDTVYMSGVLDLREGRTHPAGCGHRPADGPRRLPSTDLKPKGSGRDAKCHQRPGSNGD